MSQYHILKITIATPGFFFNTANWNTKPGNFLLLVMLSIVWFLISLIIIVSVLKIALDAQENCLPFSIGCISEVQRTCFRQLSTCFRHSTSYAIMANNTQTSHRAERRTALSLIVIYISCKKASAKNHFEHWRLSNKNVLEYNDNLLGSLGFWFWYCW